MSFERLHPAVQHHIVNSLGWRELRELQQASIAPIIDGHDSLIVGPTAGGKTEAAALPLLSRMVTEDWSGLSVIYVSPLRALANDLENRLQALFQLLGRSVAAWHGDVGHSRRKAILRDPPDLLITTPESLEVMLVSRRVEHTRFFRDARAIVVDEIHSFGSEDRGWHLLCVLARIERIIERRLQRVGLSATVGNPDQLLAWLQMSEPKGGQVIQGASKRHRDPELQADFVGSLRNAATVIAALHHGEKRLVFCDSRANVERLAAVLREEGIETFVSHSSLSRDERRRAESAFSEGTNCVIVATSTLELGIDVGDLDRVIQIEAPTTVASFLQRMGRTGRREGTLPNTLFLTTTSEDLLRALALALLWERGYVEAVTAPPEPTHIAAQQLLALCLQEGRVGEVTWSEWIEAAGLTSEADLGTVVAHMRSQRMLEADQGMLFIGAQAERAYGRRNFMDLLSVFTTAPLIEVRHGRQHLGSVHESSFIARAEKQVPIVLLGGRSWTLEEIDWRRRIAWVVPAPDFGDSRWIGSGQALSFDLCRAMRDVLVGAEAPVSLSNRAREALASLREEWDWVSAESTTLVTERNRTRWWTFAGTFANIELEWRLGDLASTSGGSDELSIAVKPYTTPDEVRAALRQRPDGQLPVSLKALEELKFNECLPQRVAEQVARRRVRDQDAVATCIAESIGSFTGR